jgi:alpha 1,3-glucosidase
MKYDPFTLHVALDKAGRARGELYLDDGETYAHQAGNFVWREFAAHNPTKRSKSLRIASTDLAVVPGNKAVDGADPATYDPKNGYAKSVEHVRVEKIVVLGLGSKPGSVKAEGGMALRWVYEEGVAAGSGKKEGGASVLTIKDPGVLISRDWAIVIDE